MEIHVPCEVNLMWYWPHKCIQDADGCVLGDLDYDGGGRLHHENKFIGLEESKALYVNVERYLQTTDSDSAFAELGCRHFFFSIWQVNNQRLKRRLLLAGSKYLKAKE
jgi:hypothetical protein